MKILLLTDELLPGGVSKYVVDLSNELVTDGHRITVAATEGPYVKKLDSRVSFLHIPLLRKNSYSKKITGFIRSFIILFIHLLNYNYDIIHSQKRYSDLLAFILSKIFHIKHISTCHNTFSDLKMFSVFGDITIAVSHSIRKQLIDIYNKKPEKVVVIYNYCAPFNEYTKDEKIEWKKKYLIAADTKVVASVGQLIPSKDRMTLLRAVEKVKQRTKEKFVLLIVGDGHLKEQLDSYIQKHQLMNEVKILPGNTDVQMVFNIADFCVLSSVKEGFPYVILEAASIGKPHIATLVGGVIEFIEDEVTGLLVEPKNPEMLADAILRLIDDNDLRTKLGLQAYKKFYNEFSNREQYLEKIIDVYTRKL